MIPISTPLGELETGISVGDTLLSTEERRPEFGAPMMFQDDAVMAVCLAAQFRPELPADMAITDCNRVRWTIMARGDTGPVSVAWTWRPGYLWETSGADSGQYFDAMTYQNDDHIATIATRDQDWLAKSAAAGDFVPERFSGDVDEFYMLQWVKYRGDGFTVDVPSLKAGERVTVFLSAAWGRRARGGDGADSATYFAADLALLW